MCLYRLAELALRMKLSPFICIKKQSTDKSLNNFCSIGKKANCHCTVLTASKQLHHDFRLDAQSVQRVCSLSLVVDGSDWFHLHRISLISLMITDQAVITT